LPKTSLETETEKSFDAMQSEAEPAEENKVLEVKLDGTARDLESEKRRKTFWKAFAIVIVCFCLYQKKSGARWLPVSDSQQMCVMASDWWGLKVRAFYPVWTKPTGQTDEYSEQWCIKYPDNTWRVFYGGLGELPAYKYPSTNYNTYF
jgi:hypothetical protein